MDNLLAWLFQKLRIEDKANQLSIKLGNWSAYLRELAEATDLVANTTKLDRLLLAIKYRRPNSKDVN